MDLQKIKDLIDVLAASDLAEIEWHAGDQRLRLVRRWPAQDEAKPQASPAQAAALLAARANARANAFANAAPHKVGPSVPSTDASQWVTAPLYGVVHLTPSPQAAPFVQLGEDVQAGQTLCVIEAMKIFHEVKASRPARVVAILATAGQEAEAGAALFQLSAAP